MSFGYVPSATVASRPSTDNALLLLEGEEEDEEPFEVGETFRAAAHDTDILLLLLLLLL